MILKRIKKWLTMNDACNQCTISTSNSRSLDALTHNYHIIIEVLYLNIQKMEGKFTKTGLVLLPTHLHMIGICLTCRTTLIFREITLTTLQLEVCILCNM